MEYFISVTRLYIGINMFHCSPLFQAPLASLLVLDSDAHSPTPGPLYTLSFFAGNDLIANTS